MDLQPTWVQLRVEPDGYTYWEISDDAVDWITIHEDRSPCDLTDAAALLYAWAGAPPQPMVRSAQQFIQCVRAQ